MAIALMPARHVKSTGPIPARVMLIGERPGLAEHRRGVCFCGPSGEELDRYLRVNTGIDRSSVRVSNLVPYYSEEPPTREEILDNECELHDEIKAVNPSFIGLVGLHSARAFLGQHVDMEWAHGLMFPAGNPVAYMPLYHPAAGMHQPAIAGKIAWDFEQLGEMLRGVRAGWRTMDTAVTDYREIKRTILSVTSLAGVDTEGTVDEPWCASISLGAGHGVVCRPHGDRMVEITGRAVMHNAIHDLPVLRAMGIRPEHIGDTMLMAALLGTEPLGLKALAMRHCGMAMSEYDDVMRDARQEKALEYLARILEAQWR